MTNAKHEQDGVRCVLCGRRIWGGGSRRLYYFARYWPNEVGMATKYYVAYKTCLRCADTDEFAQLEGCHADQQPYEGKQFKVRKVWPICT